MGLAESRKDRESQVLQGAGDLAVVITLSSARARSPLFVLRGSAPPCLSEAGAEGREEEVEKKRGDNKQSPACVGAGMRRDHWTQSRAVSRETAAWEGRGHYHRKEA